MHHEHVPCRNGCYFSRNCSYRCCHTRHKVAGKCLPPDTSINCVRFVVHGSISLSTTARSHSRGLHIRHLLYGRNTWPLRSNAHGDRFEPIDSVTTAQADIFEETQSKAPTRKEP